MWNAFHITLSPGSAGSFGYTWGDDHGAQMALAREFTGSTRNNALIASGFGVVRNSNNSLSYLVTITNRGGNVATFELIGGNLG
jgi:hypothetical protein